jgi:hypothetical protein
VTDIGLLETFIIEIYSSYVKQIIIFKSKVLPPGIFDQNRFRPFGFLDPN